MQEHTDVGSNPAEDWLVRMVWSRVRKIPSGWISEAERQLETERLVRDFRGDDAAMLRFAERNWGDWESWQLSMRDFSYQYEQALFGPEICGDFE